MSCGVDNLKGMRVQPSPHTVRSIGKYVGSLLKQIDGDALAINHQLEYAFSKRAYIHHFT